MTEQMNKKVRVVLTTAFVAAMIAAAIVAIVKMDITGDKTADTLKLAPVDPNLLKWRQVARWATGFDSPKAVVAAAGKIYLAGDKAIRVLDESGGRIGEWSLPAEPSALAVAGDGRVLVAMGNRVIVYDSDGALKVEWPPVAKKAYITSVAVSGADVFMTDSINFIVWRLDGVGRVKSKIDGKVKSDDMGFIIRSPYFDVAVAPDGLLRIVNPGELRIEAYTFDGERRFAWGKSEPTVDGFSGCCNPANIAVAGDGRIVTAEKSPAPAKVKVFERDGPDTHFGTVESVVVTAKDFDEPSIPLDVAIDSRGRVFVLELRRRGRLRIFERVGER